MTWEETNKDMGAYQQALDAQTSSGADSRVAEGRARRAAVRAYRSEHPEEEAAHAAQARTAAPARAAAAAGAAPAAAAAARGPARRSRRAGHRWLGCRGGRADDRRRARGAAAHRQHPHAEEGRARQAP